MHQTMPLKHRVCINVCDGRGNKQPVLRSGTARIPKRLLKWLFGDFCMPLPVRWASSRPNAWTAS